MAAIRLHLPGRPGGRLCHPLRPGQDRGGGRDPLAGPDGRPVDDVQPPGPVPHVHGLHGAVDLLDRGQHCLRGDVGADPAPDARLRLRARLRGQIQFLSAELAERFAYLDKSFQGRHTVIRRLDRRISKFGKLNFFPLLCPRY